MSQSPDNPLRVNHLSSGPDINDSNTVFGHPTGLFTLFFAEMWERFSYYGMRALLVLYMLKGFLAYGDKRAYEVYGAYTALVYATPFIGGMLADKLLGARRAVILGGTLMALGHLLMGIQRADTFFVALSMLIVGNGFFKPNISTIAGSLYKPGSPKRDAGFTIFYMGINLGAAMAPLLCGYVGEKYGWHYGFNLATLGMMIGLAVFVAPTLVTQLMIMGGALGSAVALFLLQNSVYSLVINSFVAVALVTAACVAWVALARGGLPAEAGAAPAGAPASGMLAVLVGVVVAVPLFTFLVQAGDVAGTLLLVFGGLAFLGLFVSAVRSPKVERERLFVALILMFFSALFWAFFEQAGSSVSNFTDRNVDRISNAKIITRDQIGQTIPVEMGQGQLGYKNGDAFVTMTELNKLHKEKEEGKADALTVQWTITEQNVGMQVGGNEMPASTFQAANAIFIVTLGLMFSALWGFLGARGLEPSTPVKFSLGLIQLGLGFVSIWYGSVHCDARGMVWVGWLLLTYLLHTTGELCLSPVGLSMVTKLSPARMVSTVMGAWFLATAFSNFMAAKIAALTGVSGEGKEATIPIPLESVHVYGGVFINIAYTALASGLFCLVLSPLLKKWMHSDYVDPIPHGNAGSSQIPEEEFGFSPPSTELQDQ